MTNRNHPLHPHIERTAIVLVLGFFTLLLGGIVLGFITGLIMLIR